MRMFFLVLLVAISTSCAVRVQPIPTGVELVSDDTFPAAILPHLPGSITECYVEQRGTIRTLGMEQGIVPKYATVPVMYVAVLFTPPLVVEHPNTCRHPTRVWMKKESVLRMLDKQQGGQRRGR